MEIKKMPNDSEMVFVIENKPSIHYGPEDYIHIEPGGNIAWKEEVLQSSAFVERWLAEQDKSTLQIIPYVLIYDKITQEIFCYQRKGGGEKRLEGNYSIGIGGHVNSDDTDVPIDAQYFKNETVTWDTVLNGAVREVSEEVMLDEDYVREHLQEIGVIYTPTDDGGNSNRPGPLVGEVHIGIIYVLPVEYEIGVNEDTLINPTFIRYPNNVSKYEKWSQLILSQIEELRKYFVT
jgi:predicted NUDIX family phosphoesterase